MDQHDPCVPTARPHFEPALWAHIQVVLLQTGLSESQHLLTAGAELDSRRREAVFSKSLAFLVDHWHLITRAGVV